MKVRHRHHGYGFCFSCFRLGIRLPHQYFSLRARIRFFRAIRLVIGVIATITTMGVTITGGFVTIIGVAVRIYWARNLISRNCHLLMHFVLCLSCPFSTIPIFTMALIQLYPPKNLTHTNPPYLYLYYDSIIFYSIWYPIRVLFYLFWD